MARRPLTEGKSVSAADYEAIAKAVFEAYGTNGVDLRIVNGRLQASITSVSQSGHPFMILPVVSRSATKALLSVKILPGSVYTGLWVDDAGTAQKGETTPTIDGDPITDDPPPTLSGLPDSFTIWLQVTNAAKDVWESTTFFVQDNADDDPENDFYNGYRKVGEGEVTESGGVYSLSITRPQTLIANINHDKANFTHYWWS